MQFFSLAIREEFCYLFPKEECMPTQNRRSKPNATPLQVEGVFASVVKSMGIGSRYAGWLMVEKWPAIVGETIAKVSHAVQFDKGAIVVEVPDSSWRHHLTLQAEEILRTIHQQPHGSAVSQIRFIAHQKRIR
jgi:Dna[CI] antecedent, DciA